MRLARVFAALAFSAFLLARAGWADAAADLPAQRLLDAPGVTGGTTARSAMASGLGDFYATADIIMMGPACLEAGARLHMAGHKLTVYGDLTISGSLYLEKGSAIVSGSLIVEGGALVMTNALDTVQVSRAFIANGVSEFGKLTAGKVKVGGDFLQLNDYSAQSWSTSGTHITEFSGANKLVQFASPAASAIRNPSLLSGTTFTTDDRTLAVKLTYVDAGGSVQTELATYATTGGTFLAISKILTADYAINVPNLYYTGAQGSWKLTVGGTLIVPPGMTWSFTGNVQAQNVIVAGALNVVTAGKTVTAAGLFSVPGSLAVTAGAVSAKRLQATEGALDASEASGAALTISKYTPTEIAIAAPALQLSGGLGGRNLDVTGSLAVPADETLDVGGGWVDVLGDMAVYGALVMDERRDAVVVGGAFTAAGDQASTLTDGYLVVKGDFTEAVGVVPFVASGAHRTLLCGSGPQAVALDGSDGSTFANLYVLNPTIPDGDAQVLALPCTGTRAWTSTRLSGIGLTSGDAVPLCPPFDGRADYEAAVPRGADTVTVAPGLLWPNQTTTLRVGGSALPGVDVPVPAETATTVAVEVVSAAGVPYEGAGEPFASEYSVTLQPQNPELTSPGMEYAMDGPFSADDTAYAVTVPAKDESFTFAPALANPASSFRFVCGGQEQPGPAFTRAIAPGGQVAVDVVVTSYANASSPIPAVETYTFTFRRQPLLDGIGLSTGSLNEPFDRGTAAYTVDVPAAAWSVIVTPQLGDGAASCAINGDPAATSVELLPPIGGSATAEIALADDSGTYARTYTVTVRRSAVLSDIAVSYENGAGGTEYAVLRSAFSSAVLEYAAIVPINASVTIGGVKEAGCTALTVGGQPDTLQAVFEPLDALDVPIVASAGAADEQKATYRLHVSAPLIKDLGLTAGTMAAPFDPDGAVPMRIVLPYGTASVTLVPIGNDRGQGLVSFSYSEHGSPVGSPVFTLAQGQTREIVIRAECATGFGPLSVDYNVTLVRELSDNANLRSFGASGGWLTAPFSQSALRQTLMLPETISSVTIRPAVADPTARYRIDSLAANTPRTVSVALNGSVTVKVAVTALKGNVRTYELTVRRRAMLSSLSASPVYAGYPSLSPGGTDRLTFSYGVTLPASVRLEIRKGGRWYTVLTRTESSAGVKSVAWSGKVGSSYLPSGTYSARLTPVWAGKSGTPRTLTVKILPKPAVTLAVSPATLRANGVNKLTVSVKWTRLCNVRVDVLNGAGAVVRTLCYSSNLAPSTRKLYWDGKNTSGALVPTGAYRIRAVCGGASPVYKSFAVRR